MSRIRLAASFVLVLAALAAGAWWSVSAFPLRGAPGARVGVCTACRRAAWRRGAGFAARHQPAATADAARATGRTSRTASTAGAARAATEGHPARDGDRADRCSTRRGSAQAEHPAEPEGSAELLGAGKDLRDGGRLHEGGQTLEAGIKAVPSDPRGYMELAGFYNRQGNFEKTMDALNRRLALDPQDPEAHYTIAAYYWEKAYRDFRLSEARSEDLHRQRHRGCRPRAGDQARVPRGAHLQEPAAALARAARDR